MERKYINFNAITQASNSEERLRTLQSEINRVEYVSISDAIQNRDNSGQLVLQYLKTTNQHAAMSGNMRTWRLRVIRDEWGNEPIPGNSVIYRRVKPLKDFSGRTIKSNVVQDMKRRGTFEKNFVENVSFEIDAYGCIVCPYEPAAYFLSQFGVHWETREPTCGKREISSSQSRSPDGSMRHIWYWRYEEVPPWVEAPKIKAKK